MLGEASLVNYCAILHIFLFEVPIDGVKCLDKVLKVVVKLVRGLYKHVQNGKVIGFSRFLFDV